MPLDTWQQKWLPLGLNPQACIQDMATESSRPGIPLPELGKVYAAEHQFRHFQPPFKTLLSSYGQQFNRLSTAPEEALKSSQKRLLVFDHSGNQTRFLQSGFPSYVNLEKGFNKEHASPVHEDNVNGKEESEMHEDTDEINALLYSDDDEEEEEDNDDWDSDDDEVKSTGHSPYTVEQQACNKTTKELDESESSEDGPCLKRQKLHIEDSSLSLVGTKSFTKLKGSSAGSGLSDEQSRNDKIHTALRILESVVPGAKGKEALLLLDEAIDYLKLLKRNLKKHW